MAEVNEQLLLAEKLETALRAEREGDGVLAFRILCNLSEDHYAPAIVQLGRMYELGACESGKDIPAAVEHYRRAACQNDVEGNLNLARVLLGGIGVTRDPERALHLYEQVIEKEENQYAYFGLGWIHHHGLGARRDLSRARQLYLRAANAGHPLALASIKDTYWTEGRFLLAVTYGARALLATIKLLVISPSKLKGLRAF